MHQWDGWDLCSSRLLAVRLGGGSATVVVTVVHKSEIYSKNIDTLVAEAGVTTLTGKMRVIEVELTGMW